MSVFDLIVPVSESSLLLSLADKLMYYILHVSWIIYISFHWSRAAVKDCVFIYNFYW